MRLFKTINPLLWRVIVFLCLFVGISGAAGPRIISGGILFQDGFGIYGGVGKAMIFALIAFVLLARHNKSRIELQPWQPLLLFWFAAAASFFVLAWVATTSLLAGHNDIQNLITAHGGLLLCLVFAAIGCFGPKNMQLLWRQYKREIVLSAGLAIAFFLFLTIVYALWQPLAAIVLYCVHNLLMFSGLQAVVVPPNTLIFDKFGITVAEYCSGIESIALFTSLYALVGLLDWKRLNVRRYIITFPFALIMLFMLNIVRVYALIMAGYYINTEIAFSLFHTYAGMIFFILYSAAFWAVAYKYLLKDGGHQPARPAT